MTQVMKGIRVLEVAQFTFVPAAGAILADWGADVVKIEHPMRGDAQRGFINMVNALRLYHCVTTSEVLIVRGEDSADLTFDEALSYSPSQSLPEVDPALTNPWLAPCRSERQHALACFCAGL
jgi:hypothetical protein